MYNSLEQQLQRRRLRQQYHRLPHSNYSSQPALHHPKSPLLLTIFPSKSNHSLQKQELKKLTEASSEYSDFTVEKSEQQSTAELLSPIEFNNNYLHQDTHIQTQSSIPCSSVQSLYDLPHKKSQYLQQVKTMTFSDIEPVESKPIAPQEQPKPAKDGGQMLGYLLIGIGWLLLVIQMVA